MSSSNGVSRERAAVLDSWMSYRIAGSGPAVLFLHGNPTSSYIWRNVIPHLSSHGRCIAPDLIGFGDSGKPDIEYSFADQARYLDAFIEMLRLTQMYIVAQDWGTALAFHYAARYPQNVKGIAFMEFIRPMEDWDSFHQRPEARELFKAFRTPGMGEDLILKQNMMLERVLPQSVFRQMSEEELDAYRSPFLEERSRKPILKFTRELPIAGEPRETYRMIEAAHKALLASQYPKLLFFGNPGALISPDLAQQYGRLLTHCELVELGAGAHFLQEDYADTIGKNIGQWLERTDRSTSPLVGQLTNI